LRKFSKGARNPYHSLEDSLKKLNNCSKLCFFPHLTKNPKKKVYRKYVAFSKKIRGLALIKKFTRLCNMPKNPFIHPYDLISPDGKIIALTHISSEELEAIVEIEDISSTFIGYQIDLSNIHFNIKSTMGQLGIDGFAEAFEFLPKFRKAQVKIRFKAFTYIGVKFLSFFTLGMYVGKLFAADDRRRVRKKEYLERLFKKTDEKGNSLLLLGEEYKSATILEQPDKERIIAKVPLVHGYFEYEKAIEGFLETISKGLLIPKNSFRKFLSLHQVQREGERKIPEGKMLLVKTMSMNIRTLFAKVANDELPKGFKHASSDLIEPDLNIGEIFEFHGDSDKEISHIPLEFYTLEPFREHFFFSDRDQLITFLENPEHVFKAFETAPKEKGAIFIAKGEELTNITEKNWILSDHGIDEQIQIPPVSRKEKSVLQRFIESQAIYPIVKAMQEGNITSQGIILSNFLPAPSLKNFFLNERVTRSLKAIYFRQPSQKWGDFFSHDDRAMLQDLAKVSVDVFWVDFEYRLLLKYVLRSDKDSGMFVPIDKEEEFKQAIFFGIYGSRLKETDQKEDLFNLFRGLLQMKQELDHELLNPEISLAITTGGGPGVMSMGNQIASELGILSCGHAVDFRKPHETEEVTEMMNPYIQAKMTYRLEQLLIRQSEFSLDFPIFLQGGVGTDFEFALESLRTQVGNKIKSPILLFGSPDYWREKITSNFQLNRKMGTIKGSEWISNSFFCVENCEEALSVYYRFFTNRLPIGKDYPPKDEGFVLFKDLHTP
jgi:predicted Rossmann-fold nucleotide-binding protein